MSARSFLDTNVLVYSDDRGSPRKQKISIELFESLRLKGTGVVSTQVLQEYFAAATKKLGVSAERARRKIELVAQLDLVIVDLAQILGAVDLHRLRRISIWDALILRSALDAGCTVLYSEDLATGGRIDGVEIIDPFA